MYIIKKYLISQSVVVFNTWNDNYTHVDHYKWKTLLVPTFCCISCFWSCSFRMRSSFSLSCCCLNCMTSCRLKMGKSRLRSIGILSWSFSNSGQLFSRLTTWFFQQPLLDWKISWSECYNSLLHLSFETYVWVRIKLLNLNLFLQFLYFGTW